MQKAPEEPKLPKTKQEKDKGGRLIVILVHLPDFILISIFFCLRNRFNHLPSKATGVNGFVMLIEPTIFITTIGECISRDGEGG